MLRIDPHERVIYEENSGAGIVVVWILDRALKHTLQYNPRKTPDFRDAELADEFTEVESKSSPMPNWMREIINFSDEALLERKFWLSKKRALAESEIEYRKRTGRSKGPSSQ